MDRNKKLGDANITYAKLEFENSESIKPEKLRGYMGYFFLDDFEFHHHGPNSYKYPLIQYKLIGKEIYILGLGEYSKILFKKIPEMNQIVLPGKKIKLKNILIEKNNFKFEYKKAKYEFLQPWIALNEENYKLFYTLKKNEQKEKLEKILVGNILSALKGLSIYSSEKIEVKIDEYSTKQVRANKNTFIGFKTVFSTNIKLPKYLGLGKSVSKGFGAIGEYNDS